MYKNYSRIYKIIFLIFIHDLPEGNTCSYQSLRDPKHLTVHPDEPWVLDNWH